MDQNLQALLLFTISVAFTPGPNNLMITASGANFGFWRSLPHMMGVTMGFPIMLIAMAVGLLQLFETWPALHVILRYAGAIYMIYLAYRIATATSIGKATSAGSPLSFLEAVLFQWINPKAVINVLSILTLFTTTNGNFVKEVTYLALVTLFVTLASISTWCIFGISIGHLLKTPRTLRAFNLGMAIALIASLILIFR